MSAADEGRSLGELVASATADLSALVHDEIALAKAELRQDVKRAAFGGSATLIAAVLGLFALPMFSFALAYWLRSWWDIPLALAFTVVGGLYVALAALLMLTARGLFTRISPPARSIRSAKESAAVFSGVRPHARAAAESATPVERDQQGGWVHRARRAARAEQAARAQRGERAERAERGERGERGEPPERAEQNGAVVPGQAVR